MVGKVQHVETCCRSSRQVEGLHRLICGEDHRYNVASPASLEEVDLSVYVGAIKEKQPAGATRPVSDCRLKAFGQSLQMGGCACVSRFCDRGHQMGRCILQRHPFLREVLAFVD